jgi:hypothetical protein
MERFADGVDPPPLNREFYARWEDHEGWDRIMTQDLRNLPNVQKGMRSRQFEHLICGRQERNLLNFHRALMGYLEP